MVNSVHLIGGSNTILKDGWATQVAALLPEFNCQNRSVGATNSVMGYFRQTVGLTVVPGDVIVWEYALNDENWVDRGKNTVEFTLKYVELCIKSAIRLGVSFLPVVFETRENSRRNRKSPYVDGLNALFQTYGIEPVNATELFCHAHGVSAVPTHEFRGNKHYAVESKTLTLVAAEVARRVRAQDVPPRALATPQGPDESDVVFFSNFTDCQSFEFRNSILSVQVSRPDEANLMIARIPKGKWRVASVLLLKASRPERFKFMFDNEALVVSVTNPLKNFEKPRLTFLPVGPERVLEVSDTTITFVSQIGPRAETGAEVVDYSAELNDFGVVALHLEAVAA